MAGALTFDFEWRTTLFTVLLLPVLITLGFWQLQRADEKTALAASFEQRQHSPPQPLSALDQTDPEALAYLPVKLSGRFRNGQTFLLDNRMHSGRFGNEALTVFELDSGGFALVNRGWLAADSSRMSLPQVPVTEGALEITGKVYVSPGKPYLLAEQQWAQSWPKQIQAVEMSKVAAATGLSIESLFPYPIRIDAAQPGALTVNWQLLNASPEKHVGYAVQWFSMAAVLALIYLLRSSNLWQLITGASKGKSEHD